MPSTNRVSRALYYRYDDHHPREFWEVRLHGSAITIRSGRVKTWGTTETRTYPSDAEAHDAYRDLGAEKVAEGFQPAYEGEYVPGTCDFEALTLEIREGARRAFTAARQAHAAENVNAYSLGSDDGAMTIVPICNSEEALRRRVAEEGYDLDDADLDEVDRKEAEAFFAEMRFASDEWAYFEGNEFLDLPYRRIITEWFDCDVDDEEAFVRFRDGLFESCVLALEQLDREGFFGSGPRREETVVIFEVSDTSLPSRVTDGWVRRLNPSSVFKRYKRR
jgi:predicted DNA-binding WGR domain protein